MNRLWILQQKQPFDDITIYVSYIFPPTCLHINLNKKREQTVEVDGRKEK